MQIYQLYLDFQMSPGSFSYCILLVRQEVIEIWRTGDEIVVSKDDTGSGAQRKGKFLSHRF